MTYKICYTCTPLKQVCQIHPPKFLFKGGRDYETVGPISKGFIFQKIICVEFQLRGQLINVNLY